MRRLEGSFPAWLFVGLFVVTGCAANPGADPTSGPDLAQADPLTIWDGVYTQAQAAQGQQVARDACLSCHAPAEWSHPMFLRAWSGTSVDALFENIRTNMPYDAPGSLSRDQNAALIAWILSLQGAPAGGTALPSDEAGLTAIRLALPPGGS